MSLQRACARRGANSAGLGACVDVGVRGLAPSAAALGLGPSLVEAEKVEARRRCSVLVRAVCDRDGSNGAGGSGGSGNDATGSRSG